MSNEFSYITFVNDHPIYLELLQVLIDSMKEFSKYSLIVYFVSVPDEKIEKIVKLNGDRIIPRKVNDQSLSSIYYYKPYVILHALKNGLQSGFYLDVDNVITKNCDDIVSELSKIDKFPISPIHPDNVDIPKYYMQNLGVNTERTQHYVHASCLLFKKSNYEFLKDWFANCLKSRFAFWDETCLNCTYWKNNCTSHYLPIIDPYFEQFYEGNISNQIYIYHGCKDVVKQKKLLQDLKNYFSNL
jgi:hypothetical protein